MNTTIADYDTIIREMAENHTTKEIAEEIGYSETYLWAYLKENNINTQKPITILEKLEKLDSKIRELALTMTNQEIADELGFNPRQVTKYTSNNKITTVKSKKITIRDYDNIIRKLSVELTFEEIAEEIGYSEASVRNYCKEFDIKVFKIPTIKDYKDEIIELAKSKTVDEIAEEIGYSRSRVAQFLIDHNIKPYRKPHGNRKQRHIFKTVKVDMERDILFIDYFNNWITRFKKGVVQPATMEKYRNSYSHLLRLAPDVKLREMTRDRYQRLLNDFAIDHSEITVKSFHRTLRKSLVDAFYEGILKKDPTYNIITKGYEMEEQKNFLNEKEIEKLNNVLHLDTKEIGYDHLIYLLLKTGVRFSEALGLTVADFDFEEKMLNINKTLNYKSAPGVEKGTFAPTKNPSSIRIIQLDDKTNEIFKKMTVTLKSEDLIFNDISWFNNTVNNRFKNKCIEAGIKNEEVTIHGLRHTHASILISNGLNILAVSERLGHSKPETTQNIYIHRTKELELKDKAKIRTVLTMFKAGDIKWPNKEILLKEK